MDNSELKRQSFLVERKFESQIWGAIFDSTSCQIDLTLKSKIWDLFRNKIQIKNLVISNVFSQIRKYANKG